MYMIEYGIVKMERRYVLELALFDTSGFKKNGLFDTYTPTYIIRVILKFLPWHLPQSTIIRQYRNRNTDFLTDLLSLTPHVRVIVL